MRRLATILPGMIGSMACDHDRLIRQMAIGALLCVLDADGVRVDLPVAFEV